MIAARDAMFDLLTISRNADVVIANGRDGDAAGAAFSTCERYRYALWRVWNPDAPFWTFGGSTCRMSRTGHPGSTPATAHSDSVHRC